MGFDDVMAELPKLTAAVGLASDQTRRPGGEEWMNAGQFIAVEKTLIEERIAEHQRNPSSDLSLEEIESRLRVKFRP